MSITIYPVTPSFVAEIGDMDLAALPEADLAAVKDAFWKYAVLIFPDQELTAEQHLAFARHFGPVETDRVFDPTVTPQRLADEFADISNLPPDGRNTCEQEGIPHPA